MDSLETGGGASACRETPFVSGSAVVRREHPRQGHDRREIEVCISGASSAGIRDAPGARGRILCIGDDRQTAGLIAVALAELGHAVEFALDGEAGLANIFSKQPDLVLCDLSMSGKGGLKLLGQLSEAGPQYAALPFILLTDHRDRDSELACRRLGADECLTKPVDLELLSVVVENRLRRRRSLSSAQARLTAREKDVLLWAARGKTSAEIAIILGLSERTINFHCDQAMRRLDVVNRTQAVANAVAEGLIGI